MRSIKKKINLIVNIMLVIINVLVILNISSYNVMSDAYIEKEIPKVSIKSVIYSSKYDNNYNMRKVRSSIDKIYDVYDLLNMDESKIDNLIDSKIFKSIMTKISINVMKSLRDDTNYVLFNINDYNNLVDENIDNIIKIDIPVIGDIGEKKIKKSLKDAGSNIIKDIPDTYTLTKKIPKSRKVIIYILSNENVRNILLVLDIIFIAILFLLHKSINILLEASKLMILTDCILLIFNILFMLYASSFKDEWIFIKRALNFYNYSIVYYEFIYLIVSGLFIASYKIIKRVINV